MTKHERVATPKRGSSNLDRVALLRASLFASGSPKGSGDSSERAVRKPLAFFLTNRKAF